MRLPERIPVFDPSGAVVRWLTEGRGVAIWRNVDLGSPNVGALSFTPNDDTYAEGSPPHWSVRYVETRTEAAGFLFYERTQIVDERTDTPAGLRAVERIANRLNAGELVKEAPIGTVYEAFTIERHEYETVARVPLVDGSDRPLATRYVWAVVRWSAIDRREEATA